MLTELPSRRPRCNQKGQRRAGPTEERETRQEAGGEESNELRSSESERPSPMRKPRFDPGQLDYRDRGIWPLPYMLLVLWLTDNMDSKALTEL